MNWRTLSARQAVTSGIQQLDAVRASADFHLQVFTLVKQNCYQIPVGT
jgi:hypothetical protein